MADEFSVASRLQARRAFGRAARVSDKTNGEDTGLEKVPRELSGRLLERLTSLAIEPAVVVDIGTPLSERCNQLREAYPKAIVLQSVWHERQLAAGEETVPASGATGSDPSLGRWPMAARRLKQRFSALLSADSQDPPGISADPAQLPLADASVDLVLACQVLPWCGDPGVLFRDVHRILKPGGAFFWSSVGPDTLREYRELWSAVDTYPHVFGLQDMHDLGDDMLRSGFDSPVMDRENLTVNYSSLESLLSDLRAAGAVNLASGRRKGLMAQEVSHYLEQSAAGGLSVTIEHIQGHGWKTDAPLRASPGLEPGEVHIPVSAIKRN